MTDRNLDRALTRLKRRAPLSSDGARDRALDAASAAFDDVRLNPVKGSDARRRQTSASPSGLWRIVMQNRMAIGGAAVCLVAVPLAAVMVAENGRYATTYVKEAPPAPPPVALDDGTVKTGRVATAEPAPVQPAPAQEVAKAEAQGQAYMPEREQADRMMAESRALSNAPATIAAAPEPLPAAPPPALAKPGMMLGGAPKIAAARSRVSDVAGMPREDRDRFEAKTPNGVKVTADEPVSTFSIDADTASYSWVRSALKEGRAPTPESVRVEELINYFPYADPAPETAATPFKPTISIMPTPWNPDTRLMRVAIKGFDPAPAARPKANLVFLIDTSGSMDEPNKLPLVKASLKLLLTKLQPDDHVSIVTYAGEAGVALEPTKASDRMAITDAIDRLGAGGSTAGAAGIAEAYRLARKNFDKEGVNRVLLATDGDFNVGASDPTALTRIIEKERKSGVFLSVLGFGRGNYNDALMQRLAQNGNGTAAYIDELDEAQKTLVEEAGSTLFPIAKDVKIQVEFDPKEVSEYRLIGYETRMLNREDFKDDRVDAGEVGSGASVVALYEIAGKGSGRMTEELRYGATKSAPDAGRSGGDELGYVKIRYKLPKEDKSREIAQPVTNALAVDAAAASDDARFSAAVAAFGQKLRGERFTDGMDWDEIARLAEGAKGPDRWGYRAGFVRLVGLAKAVAQ